MCFWHFLPFLGDVADVDGLHRVGQPRMAQDRLGGDAGGDTLTDIENVYGSASADLLAGDSAANVPRGRGGSDADTWHKQACATHLVERRCLPFPRKETTQPAG